LLRNSMIRNFDQPMLSSFYPSQSCFSIYLASITEKSERCIEQWWSFMRTYGFFLFHFCFFFFLLDILYFSSIPYLTI
jgi:hypothetical protein